MHDPYDRLSTIDEEGKILRKDIRRADGKKRTNESNTKGIVVNHDPNNVKIKTLSITLSKQQYDERIHTLDDIAQRYRCTRGDALLSLCSAYYQGKQQGQSLY